MHTDHYGGTLAGEDEASYLFSDDASSKDTVRYTNVIRIICVYLVRVFFSPDSPHKNSSELRYQT